MSLTRTVALIGATSLAIAGSAFGADDNDALAQIAELKAELATLKAQSGEQWLTEQRASEIRGLVQDVLADADTRTSLQGAAMVGGHDGKFFLASADGNFRLNVQGQIQVRWVMNSRDTLNTEWGFENRRTKLDFNGHVVDDSWRFRVKFEFGNDGGNGLLDEAYIDKVLDNGFSIRVGQFKAPFLREELVSSKYQLAVERSLLNEAFNQDRSIGAQLTWESDMFRVMAFYGDQIRTGQAAGSRGITWNANTTSFAGAARAEWMVAGSSFKQFDDFTSKPGEEFGALIGAAILYEDYNAAGNAAGAGKALGVTVDATVDFGGANLYAAFIWNDYKNTIGDNTNPWGFLIQGGIYVTPEVELFGRYEWGDLDVPNGADSTKLSVFTVGGNWYLNQNVKFTTDWGYAFRTISPFASGGAGYLPDVPDKDGQWVLRAQLQLIF
jgi:hypothetical protein